ncbi:MAG: alpha/beta hydrolase fold domain-containing protein [Thalassotalea sp.]
MPIFAYGTEIKTNSFTGLQENIPIGKEDGVELSINIAFPEAKTVSPRPVVILIHGGGFISGDKSSKNKQLLKLSKKGFVAASAMYRLSPDYRFPAAIEDIKLAIRFLKANAALYHINPERIIVSGSSAGSYLAVMIGVTGNSNVFSDHGLYTQFDSSVRAVAAQSAPIGDFTLSKYIHEPTVKRLLPVSYPNLKMILSAMSPATYLDAKDPPFFLSHGDKDPIVSVAMSREFVNELEKIDHLFEYHEVKGGTHSFASSAPKQSKTVFSSYLKFLKKWSI